jgi:hypothetical protein
VRVPIGDFSHLKVRALRVPSSTHDIIAMMWLLLLTQVIWAAGVLANTESILLPIPHYYDVPAHPMPFAAGSSMHASPINETHSVLSDFPIGNKFTHDLLSAHASTVQAPYRGSPQENKLLVKMNNYANKTFAPDDTLYVKLCWPATTPFAVDLEHRFIENQQNSQLDLFLVISYRFNAFTFWKDLEIHSFAFNLHVTKLGAISLPYELVDLAMYLSDVAIIVATVVVPVLRNFV